MEDDVRRLLERADELRKAAALRVDPGAALRQSRDVLEAARDALATVDDVETRAGLARQIDLRLRDLDQPTPADRVAVEAVARSPTTQVPPERVPPGQHLTSGWPVLHVGAIPPFDRSTWRFTVTGLVRQRLVLRWDELRALPPVRITSDLHCVTGWSRLDNTWEGVSVRELVHRAGTRPAATHALVFGHPAYSANLPLDALLDDDVLFAWSHDSRPLAPEHGGPLRLVVPKRYAWKSVKWAFELRLLDRDVSGYWEERGYHDEADPWLEQRFRP